MSCCNACNPKETEIVFSDSLDNESGEAEETPYETEKRHEKPRLRRMLKGFAREIVEGVQLNIISDAGGVALPMEVKMNTDLNEMSFSPHDPNIPNFVVDLADVLQVFKGVQDVVKILPEFEEEIAQYCVGIEVKDEPAPILFYFPTSLEIEDPNRKYQRNKFFTCVLLLWHANTKRLDIEAAAAEEEAKEGEEQEYEQVEEYEGEYQQQYEEFEHDEMIAYDEYGNPITEEEYNQESVAVY
eukprot:Platyproteum_vivax@DN6624_c0_g1_i1.p1